MKTIENSLSLVQKGSQSGLVAFVPPVCKTASTMLTHFKPNVFFGGSSLHTESCRVVC